MGPADPHDDLWYRLAKLNERCGCSFQHDPDEPATPWRVTIGRVDPIIAQGVTLVEAIIAGVAAAQLRGWPANYHEDPKS
jgi:hypothetical protein